MQKVMMGELNGCIFNWRWLNVPGKYNTMWNKISADIRKKFDSEPVYNKNYLKTKIKSHGDEIIEFYS